ADGRGARLAGRQAARDVLVGFDRQVRFELFGPLVVPPRAMKEAAVAHAGLSTRSCGRAPVRRRACAAPTGRAFRGTFRLEWARFRVSACSSDLPPLDYLLESPPFRLFQPPGHLLVVVSEARPSHGV